MKAPKTLAVIGVQWGDEGKGKIVDLLAEKSDVVVRYQGGGNAGHTVVVDGTKYVLHLVPSGILHRRPLCVVGNGVVVDPHQLLSEVDELRTMGVEVGSNLLVSERAHLVMPWHKAGDMLAEAAPGKIGTTMRGIGPCYSDKAGRRGFRVVDLFDESLLRERVERYLSERNKAAQAVYGAAPIHADEVLAELAALRPRLEPYVADTTTRVNADIDRGKRVLFEGAQGTLLDIDFGTYPYVTSSNSNACGISAGAGVPPHKVARVLGIAKAYCTRVGEGPFPSELKDGLGERLRSVGGEFGATTGRPRRTGWFDLVSARLAVMINGLTGLAITKLDVLSGLDEIRVCVGYRVNGRALDRVPAGARDLEAAQPVYESLPGWKEDVRDARRFEKLPRNARRYLGWLEKALKVPVEMVSVGSDRAQTIRR